MKKNFKNVKNVIVASMLLMGLGANAAVTDDSLICVTNPAGDVKFVSYKTPTLKSLGEHLNKVYRKVYDGKFVFDYDGNSFKHTLSSAGRPVIVGYYRLTTASNGESCHQLYKIQDKNAITTDVDAIRIFKAFEYSFPSTEME